MRLKALKISAAIALTMSTVSCGTTGSVPQDDNTQSIESQPVTDTLSKHDTHNPEGFVPTHPPVVIPHGWNE